MQGVAKIYRSHRFIPFHVHQCFCHFVALSFVSEPIADAKTGPKVIHRRRPGNRLYRKHKAFGWMTLDAWGDMKQMWSQWLAQRWKLLWELRRTRLFLATAETLLWVCSQGDRTCRRSEFDVYARARVCVSLLRLEAVAFEPWNIFYLLSSVVEH